MKCEHEGCEEKSSGTMRVEVIFPDCYGGMCRKHLAAWLREKADEVEGVKECPECEGTGLEGWYYMQGTMKKRIIGIDDCGHCIHCDGSGKVPR